MSYIADKKYTVSGKLAAAVVDSSGTLVVSYPSGTSQLDFNAGLARFAGHYIVLSDGSRWNAADADIGVTFGASNVTISNTSGSDWAAGTDYDINLDVVDNVPPVFLCIPIALAGVTAADVVTEMRPGVAGYLEHMSFIVTTVVTTGSKAATLNAEIDTTNVTGGTIALTSANCTPLGAVIEAAAITAANRLERTSKLSIEASSVTAFAEGAGLLVIRIRPDSEN